MPQYDCLTVLYRTGIKSDEPAVYIYPAFLVCSGTPQLTHALPLEVAREFAHNSMRKVRTPNSMPFLSDAVDLDPMY